MKRVIEAVKRSIEALARDIFLPQRAPVPLRVRDHD
jgi:hypothetical protein